ncbi:MAG: serine hydrolase family protein [Candidatus Kerfeldbacteria bacterium]|nr:serine hydrolase family protein [Candidatus Kerfeldbacteria bacterium]
MKVFIIHGADGHPHENWFPWLKTELERRGHRVVIPAFPTPQHQTMNHWLAVFERCPESPDRDTVFVGHSLGVPFILRVLETVNQPVRTSFLVAGFARATNKQAARFVPTRYSWMKIKQHCHQFVIFHSDKDPYVPLEHGQELARLTDGQLIVVPGAGHFNAQSGYTSFPQLLEQFQKPQE